jgi:hypothetical protein
VEGATRTWLNTSGGLWSNAGNWSGGFVPGAGDTALINANGTYSVTLDTTAEVASLTIGGGTGTQTLLWTAGGLAGNVTVAANGVLNFGGDNSKVFTGGSLTNHGQIVWPSSGPIYWYFSTAHIQNQPGGVIDMQKDGIFTPYIGAVGFHNAGTFRKSAGTGLGQMALGIAFTNASLVEVQSGTLQFQGGFTSTNTFNVASGAAIELYGGMFNFQPGHTFTGSGFYGVASGGPLINGPIINTNFMLTGGTLTMYNQITGRLNWVAGNLAGEVTVATNGMLNFGGDSSKVFIGGALTNYGQIVWPGNGPIYWYFSTAHIQNQPGGMIDLQKDGIFSPYVGAVSFHNAGTLRKSAGTGIAQMPSGLAFTNASLVEVQSGTLQFQGGFTSTNTFNVASGAAIELYGGTFTLLSGHNFTGTGFYGVASGGPLINGPIINTNFMLTGGTLTMYNQITGRLNWVGGNLAGEVTVATNGMLNFGGDNSKTFIGGALTNYGQIVWPGNGPIYWYFSTAHIQNQPGGVIDVQKDAIFSPYVGPVSFHNAGTLRKSAGAGLAQMPAGLAFTNASFVDVQSGTYQFQGGFTSTNTFNVASGAAIELYGGTFNFELGHTFTGAGFYGVASGGPVINGPIINTNFMLAGGTLTMTNQVTGRLNWVAGNLAGEVTVATNGMLDFGGDHSKTFTGGSLTNYGQIVWPNSGPIYWYLSAMHLQNQPGGVIDVQKDGIFTPYSGAVSFHNAGTLRKSAGTGIGQVSVAFTNAGTIQAYSGLLDFNSSYAATGGTLTYGIGGETDFGRINVAGNAPFTGSLGAVLLNGFRPATNTSFPVMTFASSSGSFADTSGLYVGSGRYFAPVYSATSLSLLTFGTNEVNILTQPQSLTVISPNNATFSVAANGVAPLAYQWRFGGSPIANATGNVLTVTNTQLINAGNYDVVVTNSFGSATSVVATLTVYVKPGLIQGAISQTAGSGQSATFTVDASGVPPASYQWFLNGVAISGATSASYNVPVAGSTNSGIYSVVISNAAGSITNVASLALVDLKMFAGIVIDGPTNSQYRVDYTTDVNTPSTNWIAAGTVILTTRPFYYFDVDSPALPRRFYRAVPVE